MRIDEKINALARLVEIGQELASATDTDELLVKISNSCVEVCNTETASIILLDEENNEMYFKVISGELGEIIKTIRIPLSENSIAGTCIINQIPIIVNDVSSDPRHYKKVDEKTGFVTRQLLAVPISWGEKRFGCAESINKLDGSDFTDKDVEYLAILAHQAAISLNNVYIMQKLQNFFSHAVEIIIAALETLEPYTKGHIIRVARYSTAIAREIGISGKDLENVLYAAYFHEIGKLRQEVIFLSQQNRFHPVLGSSMLEKIKLLEDIAPIVRHQHEKFDGSGYPNGLKGEEIPLGARILSLADDFDRQISDLEFPIDRQAFRTEFFKQNKKTHDPKLLKVFEEIAMRIPEDSL